MLIAMVLCLFGTMSLVSQSPNTIPLEVDLKTLENIPSVADIEKIESKLLSVNKDTENTLADINDKVIRLQEFIEESAIRIKSLEAAMLSTFKDDESAASSKSTQLESELRVLKDLIQQLQQSQLVFFHACNVVM